MTDNPPHRRGPLSKPEESELERLTPRNRLLNVLDGVGWHIAIGCFNSFMKYAKLRALDCNAGEPPRR